MQNPMKIRKLICCVTALCILFSSCVAMPLLHGLILPAFAMEEYSCAMEAHTHGEGCFAQGQEHPICGMEEHQHTQECEPVSESATQPTTEPATEPTTQPTTEPTTQPTTEPTTQPTTQPTDPVQTTTVPNETEAAPDMMLMAVRPMNRIDGGTCANAEGVEDALTWTVQEVETNQWTITISGTGGIPDYPDMSLRPWDAYKNNEKIKTIIIEDGITSVGQNAFRDFSEEGYSFGADVHTIGEYAFAEGAYYIHPTVCIPGNVKKIADYAFYNNKLCSLTLEEGVEEIGACAFQSAYASIEYPHIPASVVSIGRGAFLCGVIAYSVDPENQYYSQIDGVLFSKDGSVLVAYPPKKVCGEYRVPECVRVIKEGVFAGINTIGKLYIPGTVENMEGTWGVLWGSSYEEVYIEDGVQVDSYCLFYHCNSLKRVRLPEDQPLWLGSTYNNTNNLEYLHIPAGATSISGGFSCAPNVEVYYNMASDNPMIYYNGGTMFPQGCRVDLTIGKDVNVLPWTFYEFGEKAEQIRFEGPNYITINDGEEKGALEYAMQPLAGLVGTVYADEDGVLYRYDKASATAELVYVPPGLNSVQVPAVILAEDGTPCAVTGVRQDCLKAAQGLESIAFADPGAVKVMESYALANCITLTSVNGKSTLEEAAASFTAQDLAMGYEPFFNTGLMGAKGTGAFEENMDGSENLTLSKPGMSDMTIEFLATTLEWKGDDQTGGYRLLTGDTLMMQALVGNIVGSDDNVYRLYFQTGSEDSNLSIVPGVEYTYENGLRAVCHATEAPDVVYLEFVPLEGKTNVVYATEVYASPTSGGGSIKVWGAILTKAEAQQLEDELIEPEAGKTIQAYWTTKPEPFVLSNTSVNAAPELIGDGAGKAMPDRIMSWKLEFARAEDASEEKGKDYVSSVDFKSVLEFPAGAGWSEAVIEAVKNGDISYVRGEFYAADVCVAEVNGGTAYLFSPRLVWDEEADTVAICWTVRNPSRLAEIGANSFQVNVQPEAVRADMSVYDTEAENVVRNIAEASVNYTYGEPAELTASADKPMGSGAAKLVVRKTSDRSGRPYFGEAVTYTVQVENTGGLPFIGELGVYSLRDSMNGSLYITPENMERMFAEDPTLTITIYGARVAEWSAVTATDGTASWKTPENADLKPTPATLRISCQEDGYTVEMEGTSYQADTVREVLKLVGYGVTRYDSYRCEWPLNAQDTPLQLSNGTPIVRKVYANFKTSFQLLKEDWLTEYSPDSTVWTSNIATVHDPAGNEISRDSIGHNIRREAKIEKEIYKNGLYLNDVEGIRDGDVLDYHILFTHYGTGTYRDLPMVDDIYGSQYLLVPKDQNPDLAALNLPEHEGFYALTPGSYSCVVVGVDDEGNFLTAESVTVDSVGREQTEVTVDGETNYYSGLHTQIKWYFSSLPGEEYQLIVSYQTLVDMSLGSAAYTAYNVVWMNDVPGDRIYTAAGGGGSTMEFDKQIVTQTGGTPQEDVLEEESLVGPGEAVTYRLTLSNPNQNPVTVHGDEIADRLPMTFGTFEWEKGVNVDGFRIAANEDVAAVGMEDWYLGNEYGAIIGTEDCYILWPETAYVTLPAEGYAYLYFTLTYPDRSGNNAWDAFAEEAGGDPVQNTMYFYRESSSVTHELKESGSALLQKGILGMYHYWKDGNDRYIRAGNSRYYYNNRDSRYRAVVYYVVICNDGNKRLYLNDVVDQLPEGFTFWQLMEEGDPEKVSGRVTRTKIVTKGGEPFNGIPIIQTDANLLYRSATVTATPTQDGVTFHFSTDNGGDLHYDEDRQMYYLKRDEVIVFAYSCDIGSSDETESEALNRVGMQYYDYLGTGVNLAEDIFVTSPDSAFFADKNDGTAELLLAEQAEELGFPGDGSVWLESNVTVQRGKIVPGLTKAFTGYTDTAAGITVQNPSSVNPSPNNLLHWKVMLNNSGTLSITDYTITDIMPAPFCFQGDVVLHIYDRPGGNEMYQLRLATIPVRTGTEETLQIKNSSNAYVQLDLRTGTQVSLNNQMDIRMSIARDDEGNEVLSLYCADATLSIPEGGYVELSISSCNPTTSFQNAVYLNRAMLTPNVQSFSNVGQGSMVRDSEGTPVAVENSAPVTVSYGFSTSSEKRVQEKDSPQENVAASSGNQKIYLNGTDSIFTYTLSVSNDTPNSMTRLVLIDSLPQVSDTSPFNSNVARGSEFRVDLSGEPNFALTVVRENGEILELDESCYTIEFSTDTQFGGPQSADWKGMTQNTAAHWTSDPAGARAIRLVIRDDTGTVIPPNAKVYFSFDACVAGEALPGQAAWNSFGYHYALMNSTQEMEAMPLPVAVAIPSVPVLIKELTDADGEPAAAEADKIFRFCVVRNSDNAEAFVDVTVKAGQSSSQAVPLDQLWNWMPGQSYSIAEAAAENGYDFQGFEGSTGKAYTFTYDPDRNEIIRCVNTDNRWSVGLTKTNEDGELLSGALFGLYSEWQEDLLTEIPDEFAQQTIPTTVEAEGVTWYLTGIEESDAEGEAFWSGLFRERYYLMELRAPDGYYGAGLGRLLRVSDCEEQLLSVTMINCSGYELPKTGGAGSVGFLGAGMAMVSSGLAGTVFRIRRKKKQSEYPEK